VNRAQRWIIVGAVLTLACAAGGLAVASRKAPHTAVQVAATPDTAATRPRDAQMIVLPVATSVIGDDNAPRDERPQFEMEVAAFILDRSPVTVRQFRAFVDDTGYVTEAERLGDAGVFTSGAGTWALVKGANWKWPSGRDKPPSEDDHPVTQVSWNDASAFCRAYGARLPTEFEWERAARMGQTPDGTVFLSGAPASLEARLRVNTWQGIFPVMNTGDDGYLGTSPVGAFGSTPSGFTDLAGNVWEWTSSPYAPYPPAEAHSGDAPAERVQRGGSFLCDRNVCQGFRVTARSHSTPDTALMHVGFRCAADLDAGDLAGQRQSSTSMNERER